MKNYEGREKCRKCNGKGYVFESPDQSLNTIKYCPKCRGVGKLDWLEQIFGIKEKDVPTWYMICRRYWENKDRMKNFIGVNK